MSKRDLATTAAVSPVTVKRAERGEPVQSTTAKKLADTLGVRPSRELGRVLD